MNSQKAIAFLGIPDQSSFKDICEFLDNIMKKNNYLIDMDSLVKKYQNLPSQITLEKLMFLENRELKY